MNKKNTDVAILGLALFAMFFGAGNLLFPPSLGILAGKSWIVCAIGFFLTATGLPLLGVIAVCKAGGTIDDIGNKVHPLFSKIFATAIVLAIGPLFAIPRTGATTFEMSVKPLFPGVSPLIASIIFFAITLYFVIKPSQVVDKIGKLLTPLLLIMIFFIIFKGIFSPIGTATTAMHENPLSKGFSEGYQTMDALASLMFGGIILTSVINKGYSNKKEQISLTIKATIIAALGLGFVYIGLIYLGACSNSVYPIDTPRADLLIAITNNLLGNFGKIALGIVVSLACLTTSIGLTATVGDFFNKLSNDKLSYRAIVIFTVVFSAVFATVGVEKLVVFAVPALVALYPVSIVLILANVFSNFVPKGAYSGAVIGALSIGLYDALVSAGVKLDFIGSLINKIPLASEGFAWIIPSIVCGIISAILLKGKTVKS